MKRRGGPEALFYPFHLCHRDTLERLLRRFQAVHFRDFMALQLTPFFGMTARRDRMGDYFPGLLRSGRIVQGYEIGGPITREAAEAIDRDLQDPVWRSLFHEVLRGDARFQRGLFPVRPGADRFHDDLKSASYTVESVLKLAVREGRDATERFEYALALLRTSASLVHTARLALGHGLQAATDSLAHYSLFERSCGRESAAVRNHLLLRHEY